VDDGLLLLNAEGAEYGVWSEEEPEPRGLCISSPRF
jgi:hypothetical protein